MTIGFWDLVVDRIKEIGWMEEGSFVFKKKGGGGGEGII